MVTLQQIEAATARIRGEIYVSPLVHSKALSALSGNEIYLKLDNLQMTGSFKERGALNRILTLTDAEKARGVVAASAGNHGQAVAYHATRRGIRAQIWMPRYTPLVKLSATSMKKMTNIIRARIMPAVTASRQQSICCLRKV